MTALILDPLTTRAFVERRVELGHDRHDEVWDGVYVVPPMPTLDQQELVMALTTILKRVSGRRADVGFGCSVSDRDADWLTNYRIPDVLAALPGGRAVNRVSHFWGGPDFVVEVRGPADDSFRKLDFYAAVGVREVLVVEREIREPTLFRLARKTLRRVRATSVGGVSWLTSQVVPLAFARGLWKGKPRLLVRRTAGAARTWRV